ncbi:MAG: amino acid permease [Mucilaginibacter sp.]|nr:amino acid permease [Mucilaginibacter sp.]
MAATPQKLGLWTSTSLVVGNMIGAGVFLMPAALASYGSISLLGWLFSAFGAFLLAKVFTNLSKLLPNTTGGPYAYTHHSLGNFAGFLVAWGYYIAVACASASIAISFVSALSTFFPVLAQDRVIAILTALCAIWFLVWINTRGVTSSGKVQLITTILKLLPLLLVAIGGLFFIRIENFHPFNSTGTSTFAAITASASFTFYAFVGIECATIPAGSVANPQKTIPRATMLGLLITTLVYILGSVSIMGIIPSKQLQHSVTPYADAAVIMWGPHVRYWVSGGVAIAAFGALNGWTLIQGQVPYAIATDKLFPAMFARKNKKGVPYAGIIVSSIMVSVFISMNYTKGLVEQFKFLLLLSLLSVLVPYLFSATAYIITRVEKVSLQSGGWISAILLFVLAFSYSLWAIAGTGKEAVYLGFLLLMAGIPFYVLIIYRNKQQ